MVVDKIKFANRIRNGCNKCINIGRMSNTRTVWIVFDNNDEITVLYNKKTKQIDCIFPPDFLEYGRGKLLFEEYKKQKNKNKKIKYKSVPINYPVENDFFKSGLKILGWKPVKKEQEVINICGQKEGSKTQKILRKLFERDGKRCIYCLRDVHLRIYALLPYATIDHFVPRSKGGKDNIDNYVVACADCNQKKADMMPDEFMRLLWGNDLSGCPHEIKIPD